MDFTTTETWIDLLVIVIAFVAVIVGIITGIKMFKQEDSVKEEEPSLKSSVQKPVSLKKEESSLQEEKEKVSKKVQEQVIEKEISLVNSASQKSFNHIQEKDTQPVNPVVSSTTRQTSPGHHFSSSPESIKPPKLEADQLSLDTPNTLLLKLRNAGNRLIYKKIKTNDHNQLDIQYQAPDRKVNKMIEEFPSGSTMTFSLSGQGIIAKTYHFTIYFGDDEGNLYTQQVAGMGKEYPIVDVPRKIA